MKRKLFFAFALLMAVAMQAETYWNGTSNKVFSGSGTQADPYLISTPEQLAGLAERVNTDKEDFAGKYIKLTADIYLTNYNDPDTANWPKWEPIAHTLMVWGEETDYGYFRGTFDGDGHTIYNLYYGGGVGFGDDFDPNDLDIDIGSYDFSVLYKALFGNLQGATLANIRLSNGVIGGAGAQALLALDVDSNSVVRNCHVQGRMLNGGAGLVTYNKGLIENCSGNNLNVALVEDNYPTGIIRDCTNQGVIRPKGGGGFVGNNRGLIERCTADVDIYALFGLTGSVKNGVPLSDFFSAGGFVLYNSGTIRECAAFGDIASDGSSVNYIWESGVAGFAYRNWGGRIESSYCTGALRDVSDSTGIGGNPTFAHFCYDNGYNAVHYNDDMARGDIINCYSTSTIYHHDAEYYKNNIHAFVASFHDYGGFDAHLMEHSLQIGYFNQDGLPAITGQSEAIWGGIGKPLAQMQTQAFVDTLNILASFMGLSQWELRDGLPRPTGVYTTNSSVLFGGGEGTKANPYIIATKAHLENLRWLVSGGLTFKGQYFLQTADIALNAPQSEWEETAPSQWKPIGSPRNHPWFTRTVDSEFDGVYDGGFHEVKNMYINNLLDRQGLFGRISRGAQLRNLGVTDAYIRSGNHGVLAGEIYDKPIVVQCWTSGNVANQGQYAGSQGALVGNMAGHGYVLNCGTSVRMSGYGSAKLSVYNDAVYAGWNVWAQDTLVNFLFTGRITNDNSGSGIMYGNFQHRENFFADKETAQVEYLGDGTVYGDPNSTVDSTRWIQSKDLVNIYNYSVARWNERHAGNDTLQLHYWEWREGDYPRVSPNASFRPPVTITFNTNGGSFVTTKYIYPDSEVLPPQRPLRSGYIFAGWYKDSELTQFFDWKSERPTSSLTLYARWHEDTRFDIDVTPFQNEFAKTYHIKTAAQLRGFAAMQNGLYSWDENVYCYDDNKTYAASNLTQTQAPMNFKGKKVVLDNDILLCDTTDWQYWGKGAFGVPYTPIGWSYGVEGEGDHSFHGTFDGQGHTVYGMYMERNGIPGWNAYGANVGLFGLVGDSAIVRNVGVAASVLDGQDYKTRGHYNDATKYWRRCGYGEQGWGHVGMLIGITTKATIEQCYAEGDIYCDNANAFIGDIDNYWSLHNDTVSNCYSRVNVYDKYGKPEGSFMASDWSATVINCYAAGETKSSICGCPSSGYGANTYNNTYYNKELATTKLSCDNSKGCTTNEMHAKATYQNWDFENIWGRNDTINDGYPYLRVFHENAPADSEDPIIVTGITLNVTDTTLVTGQTLQMEATVLPAEAANKKVTWTSTTWGIGSGNELASEWFEMDENGLITTHVSPNSYYNGRSGQIRVIATTEEGEYTAECLLTIAQPKLNMVCVARRRVGETEWNKSYNQYVSTSIEIENFEYLLLAYTEPDNAREGLTWSVDDSNILELTELSDTIYDIWGAYSSTKYHCSRAIARAKQSSSEWLLIHATLANGVATDLQARPQLNPLNYISIYQPNYVAPYTEMGIGETQQLIADYYQYVSYLPNLQWSTSDPNVLTVDQNGLVTAVGIGTATITVSAVGTNISATTETITVSVVEPTGIEINESATFIELNEGNTFQLTATVLPTNATDKTVTWRSGNTAYATVDQNGLVTGISGSTSSTGNMVNIFAATSNGIEKKQQFRIKKVLVEPTSITINENTGEIIPLYVGDTYQLTATVLPENAADKTVSWSSDDNSIARVGSTTGLVKARGEGYVVITARTNNGLEDEIQFEVTTKPVEPVYYTIRFLNYDGTELQSSQVLENTMPSYTGATPVRPADEQYTYTFSGWSPAMDIATQDMTYTAQFTSTLRQYTVRFLNYDGTELQSSQVNYGETPAYTGTTPTRPEDAQYTYTFSGWEPTIVSVTADANYTAQYKSTEKLVYYTIRFLNYDGTELQSSQVEEGVTPVYTGATPTKPEDAQYTYTFTGWLPAIVAATADAVYIAQYEAIKKAVYYTVTFMDWDGTELLVEQVEEGHDAHGPETNPTREGYIFTGWSKPITNITANLTVVAQYELETQPVYYTIRFLNWNNDVLQTSQVLEGTMPSYTGATPARPEDEQYIYTFNGWAPTIVAATADATYTATYEAKDKHEGIEDIHIDASDAPRKIMIDNVIYILRGEKVYTITGQEVR